MAQVKFYSKESLPEGAEANGVYFIDGGELYKGAQRFGLGRVTVAASTEGITGMERGDIVVTGAGDGWVYAGTEAGWKSLGGNIESLRSAWQSDIKSWTSGLVQSGEGSYITGITQDEDGKVTASASNFDTDVKEAVGDGASESTSNGVTVSVTTTSGKVTGVSVTAPKAQTWSAINVGDANSYIYNVTQGTDGQVSASAKAFPTLTTGATDGTVKLGEGADAKVSGWDTVKTDITNLKSVVSYSGTGDSVVTATTGNFTNLNVTNTATFSATEVSAGTLTVGGIAVDNVSAASATGSDAGVAVTVSTLGGGVSAVGVAVTGNLATFAGKSVVTTVGPATGSGVASDDNIATEKAVRDAIASLDNVMHFKGVVKSLPTTAEDGDIVVIGANPEGTDPQGNPLVAGQEYIYDGTKWEKIGDQSAVTGGSDSKNANGITIGVETAPATASATVTLTVDAVEAAADVSDTNKATNVVTAGAVAGFVTDITNNKASIGTGNATGGYGISGQVVLASDAQPDLTITVAPVSTSAGVTTGTNTVVTAGAVADYVTSKVAYVPTQGETVTAGTTTLDGAMHAVAGAVDTLNTNIATKASVGNSTSTAAGITGAVTLAADAAPSITMTVDTNALKTSLGLGTAAYVNTSTTVDEGGTSLPTQAAVYTFVTDLISGLGSTVTSTSGNVGVTITQTDGKLTACTVTFDWIED